MIVCQCKGVTERQIRRAVRDGATGRDEVILACFAGSSCGGCVPMIDSIIKALDDPPHASPLLELREAATG